MTLIITLILGHYLASFPFLPEYLAYNRKFNNFLLLICSLVWASTIWLILEHYELALISDYVFLFVGHVFFSKWRLSRVNKRQQFRIYLFLEWVAEIGLIYMAYKY